MLRSLLTSLLAACLMVGLLSAPVPVAASVGGLAMNSDLPAMADMPSTQEMGGMQDGADCSKAPDLPPADCGKTCPTAFGCLSQCFAAMADDAGARFLLTMGGVAVWPLRDRHRSRLSLAGPYEPPRT